MRIAANRGVVLTALVSTVVLVSCGEESRPREQKPVEKMEATTKEVPKPPSVAAARPALATNRPPARSVQEKVVYSGLDADYDYFMPSDDGSSYVVCREINRSRSVEEERKLRAIEENSRAGDDLNKWREAMRLRLQMSYSGDPSAFIFNGRQHEAFSYSIGRKFSADGKHFGYVGVSITPGHTRTDLGTSWPAKYTYQAVIDGVRVGKAYSGPPLDRAVKQFEMGPDGAEFLWVAPTGAGSLVHKVVRSGKEVDELVIGQQTTASGIYLSADGMNYAWLARSNIVVGGKMTSMVYTVYNGLRSGPFAYASFEGFVGRSKHAHWKVEKNDAASGKRVSGLVVDNRETWLPPDQLVSEVAWSANGEHFAIEVTHRQGNKPVGSSITWKGKTSSAPHGFSHIVFSPDGSRIAWQERMGRNMGADRALFVDHEEWFRGEPDIGSVQFSPDSQKVVAVVSKRLSAKEKAIAVVVDRVPQKAYKSVHSLAFSPNGEHLAYAALGDSGWIIVQDGKESFLRGKVMSIDEIIFSEDSNRMACIYSVPRKDEDADELISVWVDGSSFGPYQTIREFSFSPSGRHFAFVATGEKSQQSVVVDGIAGREFPMIYRQSLWDSPTSLRYYALKGSNVVAIAETIR